MSRKEYLISQERETALTLELAERLLRANFNASNTVIVTVSMDYSSNVGQLLRHALTKDGEVCDGFGIDVPYPDEIWDGRYAYELSSLLSLYHYKLNNKKILLVEAGVIRGSNYKFVIDCLKTKLNLPNVIYTLALFENEHSAFKSDFVGEFYDDETEDLTFWWEKENNHWTNKMTQETLEEAAKRIYGTDESKDVEYYAFIAGAKWQQERMYSEKEMINYGRFCVECEKQGFIIPKNIIR